MNSFRRRINWKLWLPIAAGMLLIGGLILWLVLGSAESEVAKVNPTQPSPSKGSGPSSGSDFAFDYNTTTPGDDTDPNVGVTHINEMLAYSGTLRSYKDRSTFAEIAVNVAGDKKKPKKLDMAAGGIVFDGSQKLVVNPSTLETSLNKQARLIAVQTEETEDKAAEEQAQVVILNDDPSIEYGQIAKIADVEGYRVLDNPISNLQFVLSKTALGFNALTGAPFDLTTLKDGDKVFVVNKGELPEGYTAPSASVVPVGVEQLYVYPAP